MAAGSPLAGAECCGSSMPYSPPAPPQHVTVGIVGGSDLVKIQEQLGSNGARSWPRCSLRAPARCRSHAALARTLKPGSPCSGSLPWRLSSLMLCAGMHRGGLRLPVSHARPPNHPGAGELPCLPQTHSHRGCSAGCGRWGRRRARRPSMRACNLYTRPSHAGRQVHIHFACIRRPVLNCSPQHLHARLLPRLHACNNHHPWLSLDRLPLHAIRTCAHADCMSAKQAPMQAERTRSAVPSRRHAPKHAPRRRPPTHAATLQPWTCTITCSARTAWWRTRPASCWRCSHSRSTWGRTS